MYVHVYGYVSEYMLESVDSCLCMFECDCVLMCLSVGIGVFVYV